MSKERNINELLSAYFDSEVTAEERARVEQFLEESVEARCELDQFGSLSESLKSLPVEPAPPELLPSVIRRAERETLLLIGERTRVSASGRKMWLTVVEGIVVAAASVILMTQFLSDETGNSIHTGATNVSSSQQVAERGSRESEVAHFADDSPAPAVAVLTDGVFRQSAEGANGFGRRETAEMDDGSVSPVASPPESDSVVANSDRSLKMKSMATRGSVKPPADSRRSIAPRPTTISERGVKKFRGSDAALTDRAESLNLQAFRYASRGDVVQYFDGSGTKITTYLVTVVDVKPAMNRLQVLLARHDIAQQQPLADNDKGATKLDSSTAVDNKDTFVKKEISADDADEKTERLFAVYIETTSGRFALALKDLMNDELFAELSLKLPVVKPPVDEMQIQVADLGKSDRYRSLFPQPVNEEKTTNSAFEASASTAKRNARFGAKTPTPRNAASPSPARPRAQKDLQAARKKKSQPDRAKSSPVPKVESPANPSVSGRAEKSKNDGGKRREGGDHIAALKRGELRSFQLEVQLAPLDANVERLQSSTQSDRLRRRNQTRQAASPVKNQPVAGAGVEESVVAEDRLSAVRVLFVFREAPRQTPQR